MTKDEALKLALEALEDYVDEYGPHDKDSGAQYVITAIKEALAQPEQEPVTWRYKIVDVFGRPAWTLKTPKSDTRVLESQPLYTTPPQRKPLSDEEINLLWRNGKSNIGWEDFETVVREIEAVVGEKQK